MKKKVGIDVRLLNQTGVGVYLRNLLHYLPSFNNDIELYVYCLPNDVMYIKSLHKDVIIREAPFLWHSFSEQTSFLHILNKDRLNLMHFTYFGYPTFYSRPYISTIHDITPLIYRTGKSSTKHLFQYNLKHKIFQFVLWNQVTKSKVIITPSQTVKNQLVQLYGQSIEKKIKPFYEGISFEFLKQSKHLKSKSPIQGEYYLYVGNFYPHKNITRLINAFCSFSTNAKLVLTGPNDFFARQIKENLRSEEDCKKIQFITDCTQEMLVCLYQNAKAFVHPSFSEGFGLPLLEAAFFQVPILASGIPIFRELLNNEYYAFDPYEKVSIIHAFQQFEHDRTPKRAVIRPELSFELMVKQTIQLYQYYGS